jgi:glutaredoxin 3
MVQGDDSVVVVWTNRGCGACVQAKRLLDSKQVAYKERRLKNTPELQRAFSRATGGARTVPQIIVDGKSVGGFDDLLNLDRSGELDVLLGRAQPSEKTGVLARFKNAFRR